MNEALNFNEALGWTLFHFLWEGATIALLLGMVMLGTRSARVRYAAACLAMLAMLAAFGATLAVKLPKAHAVGGQTLHPMLNLAPVDTVDSGTDPRSRTLPYEWAVPLWMAGVALLSLHRVVSFAAAVRLRKVGVCAAPARWQERLDRLALRLRVKRPVMLLESCLAEVPAAAGYLRPAILLPVGLLAGLPAGQVEFILLHELAHIARHDYLVNLLQSIVEALLFYHPAVWWVSSAIRNEREHCCDDVVVAQAGDARGYAAALVKLELGRVPDPALAATGGSLTRRVRRLLQQPGASQSLAGPLAAAALVVLIAGVTVTAAQPPQIAPLNVTLPHPPAPVLVAQAAPVTQEVPVAPQQETPRQARAERAQELKSELATPYRKWLNEDVAYIITDAERQVFKGLTTDAEREQFIEQFWLVRDPTPGTAENEFKEEHYRRIAYANEHFASNIPGWKTDRGRIYITYGPPDEIEDHASGGKYERPAAEGGGNTVTYPFQQWRYKLIEGVGTNVIIEFVDPTMSGEFRMTMDPAEKDALQFARTASGLNADRAQLAVLQKTYKDNYPAIVALKKKIAEEEAGANHFVANEPGGKATVVVTGHSAGLSIPLPPAGTFDIAGAVTDQSGKTVANLRDKVTNQPVTRPYAAAFNLGPGSYTLKILVRNTATGEMSTESVTFYVAQ